MALVIRGKSRCHLCGDAVDVGDELEMFPPALFDPESDLAHLNDAGVHVRCLDQMPNAIAARDMLQAYRQRIED